jgi:ABC-2 type transport system permease protein
MKDSTATAPRGIARVSSPSRSSVPAAAAPGKNVYTIAMRELRAYFDSLVAYVVLGGSLLGLGIWFFFFQGGVWQADRATMGRMFEFLPWAFSFLVIPLITMRALAEETRSGTMELLITLPVTDYDVILGKYFAALGMATLLLLATAIYPLAMFVWPWHLGALDWGPVWAGYLGLFLFSAAGIAVGLLFSSLTESQIIAFFLTAFVLVFMQIIGWLVQFLPGVVGDSISFVSFASRYEPFSRGLIDTRAVVYFISIAVLCLLIAFRSLESRKWS